MDRQSRTGLGMLLLAISAGALAQGPGLETVRVIAPAERERERAWEPLTEAARIFDGERVRIGSGGRAELQVSRSGRILLGSDTQLRLHSSDHPDPPARLGLARVVLEQGAMHVDASGRGGMPPSDLRLNVGELRLRAFGAEVWAEVTPAGEEICLLQGAVEILTPAHTERLDRAGECLRWGSVGAQRLRAEIVGPMSSRLARVAIGTQPQPIAAAALFQPAPPPVAAGPAAPGPDAPVYFEQAPVAARDEWCLVLASLPTEVAAQQEAGRLYARGLDVRVEPGDSRGRQVYRLTYGSFESRTAALRALRSESALATFAKAWPLQRS